MTQSTALAALQADDSLKQRLADSLRKAEASARGASQKNTFTLVISLLCSAGSTFVAGLTSAAGPAVGLSTTGWQIACIIAAIFSFGATILTGLNQALRYGDHLSRANEAIGRLRALDFALVAGGKDRAEAANELAQIIRAYPEVVG
jgi:hypothetical protein